MFLEEKLRWIGSNFSTFDDGDIMYVTPSCFAAAFLRLLTNGFFPFCTGVKARMLTYIYISTGGCVRWISELAALFPLFHEPIDIKSDFIIHLILLNLAHRAWIIRARGITTSRGAAKSVEAKTHTAVKSKNVQNAAVSSCNLK